MTITETLLLTALFANHLTAVPAVDGPPDVREHESRRAVEPPRVDGRLDDEAWQQAAPAVGMTQRFPDPGKPASYPTEMRILHDDEALYISARCHDPKPDAIVARVTRRDRWIESDWFQVEIDSDLDGRNGFFFAVNPAGVKVDGTLFNENQESFDWDGVWDARSRITPTGWDVEMRIPLKLLRFPAAEDVRFGINFHRRISRLNEMTQWQYIPPESGLRVSRFGVLKRLDLENRPVQLEVSPYVAARQTVQEGDVTSEMRPFDVGVDAKVGLGSNFMLTLTANPDFGQVEVDQVVLNLSTIETYYPEKRPFFLEDMSLFQTPHFGDGGPRMELFYTRRIGRAPRSPELDDGEEELRAPRLPRIYGAAKLAGRTDGRFSVGLLQAVTSQEDALVRGVDDQEDSRVGEPLTSFSILRAKQEFWKNSSIGLMSTALATGDQGAAVTGGTDLQMELFDGEYNLTVLTFASHLTEERYRWHDDFTRAALEQEGPTGYGGELTFWKKSGEHLVGAVGASYRSPNLALNDMGYLDRPDLFFTFGWLQYRHMKPLGPIARININANAWLYRNTDLLNIGDGFNVNGNVTFKNNWFVGGYFNMNPGGRCDDRETRSEGAVVLCTGTHQMGGGLWGQTDQRKFLWAGLESWFGTTERGHNLSISLPVGVNPLARMQFEVIPRYSHATGEVRWIDTLSTAEGDEYLFAERHTEYWDVTFRGTFTFTTELTLQAYAQVFLAAVDHGDKLAPPAAGPTRIHMDDLGPAPSVTDEYDFTSASLNLSAVMRWEYLPGSVAYLVYTGTFGHDEELSEFRFGDVMTDLLAARANHTLMLKLSYMWG